MGNVVLLFCDAPSKLPAIQRGRVLIRLGTVEIGKRDKDENRCDIRFIREEELIDAILRELGWSTMDQERFEREVSKVLVYSECIGVEKNWKKPTGSLSGFAKKQGKIAARWAFFA